MPSYIALRWQSPRSGIGHGCAGFYETLVEVGVDYLGLGMVVDGFREPYSGGGAGFTSVDGGAGRVCRPGNFADVYPRR
jgi:hypothetical protein